MDQATNPFDGQEVFCEKDKIPEVDSFEKIGKAQYAASFTGTVIQSTGELYVGEKLVTDSVLMKPNCCCAISQSNKRYLRTLEVPTDYVEPNILLFRALGYSESKSKTLQFAFTENDCLVDAVVTGYKNNTPLEAPEVSFQLKNGMRITREEAITVFADWLSDNSFVSEFYDAFEEYDTPEYAWKDSGVSEEAKVYADINEEDPWMQVEAACIYECAKDYIEAYSLYANAIYALLHKKYNAAGIIIASMNISCALADNGDMFFVNEIGTPNTALLVLKEEYEKTGKLEDFTLAAVMEYYNSIGYDVESTNAAPLLPIDVLDKVSDAYMYLAEAVCDDLALETHM